MKGLAPMVIASGMTIGSAMTYIPQLMPIMNSVIPKVRNTTSGRVAGVMNCSPRLIMYPMNPISSLAAAKK
jgi:hypothetical protein